MSTNADDELKEYREEQKRQDKMSKEAEDKEYLVDASEDDLDPPALNDDGSLAHDPDEENE